jgi:protein SCO1/2
VVSVIVTVGMRTPSAEAQVLRGEPEEAQGIGVDSKLGDELEPDVRFDDDRNNHVRIGDYFDGKRPIILSFNYSNCPKLCSVQLEKMTLALREVDFTAGKDFQIVSVSIDPSEQVARARQTKSKYVQLYNRPGSEQGWHFLTGDLDSMSFLADDCGVRYKYVKHQKLYSHPPVFILLSPTGKIVRYIHGLEYDPITIYRALVESAEGKIGSPINRLSYVTGCFVYDESTGRYSAQAIGIMRVAGVLTVIALLVGLVPYWIFRRGRAVSEKLADAKTQDPSPVPG